MESFSDCSSDVVRSGRVAQQISFVVDVLDVVSHRMTRLLSHSGRPQGCDMDQPTGKSDRLVRGFAAAFDSLRVVIGQKFRAQLVLSWGCPEVLRK